MIRWWLAAMLAMGTGAATAQVYRCGNAYQTTPCAGGRLVDVTPAATAGASPVQTIFLCANYQGGRFWSDQHCNHRRPPALLERMATVPADLPWSEQVRIARGEKASADAMVRSANTPPTPDTDRPSQRAVCDNIREALRANESDARAGGNVHRMEWLAERRRDIIRQQQAARCR